jgi:CDP-diacylglycerol--glycerol-3-phosphate 3-phosphatidyltransferase
VLLIQPWPALYPASWAEWSGPVQAATMALVLASVLVCLLRGAPVVWEFVADRRVFVPDALRESRERSSALRAHANAGAMRDRARV